MVPGTLNSITARLAIYTGNSNMLPRLRLPGLSTAKPTHCWSCDTSRPSLPSPRQVVRSSKWSSTLGVPASCQPTTRKQGLPKSPLADDSFLEARARWTHPKPPKSPYKTTKFQRKLAVNPFGTSLSHTTCIWRCRFLTLLNSPNPCKSDQVLSADKSSPSS